MRNSSNIKVGSVGHRIIGASLMVIGSLLSFVYLSAFAKDSNWIFIYLTLLSAGILYYGSKVYKRPKGYVYSTANFGKGALIVIGSLMIVFINAFMQVPIEESSKTKAEYARETTIPNIDCLVWDLGTPESNIVQNNWAKTTTPNEVTSYTDSYSDGSISIKRQFTFVDGKLGSVSIIWFDLNRSPGVTWAMLLDPVYIRFGDPDISQGPTKYSWTLSKPYIFIWSGYKDGYGAWITVGTRDWDIYRQVLGAMNDGLQLIY